jgi:hypothetical protein
MNPQLHPKIDSVLRAFAGRQRRLRLIRGGCVCLGLAGALLGGLAFLDWVFVLPDAVRWALSAGAYTVLILVAARTLWSALMQPRAPRKWAELLEAAEPALAQDLLSAVELGGAGETSPVYRDRLQREVADRLENLDVRRVLRGALLKPFFWAAAIVVLGVVWVCVWSGPALLLRACLPMANLARVSRVQVAVLEPEPAEKEVPFGEPVPLLITTSGGNPGKALLEVFTKSHGRELIPMAAEADGRFSAVLEIAREDVQYRVRAGDALTQKYRLNARPRPWVLTCSKQYSFPAYAGIPDRRVVDEQGDLDALEGTRVDLAFESSQKLVSAHLELELPGGTRHVPLRETRPNRWGASLPMDAAGSYRVKLRAAQTGFENKFTPTYAIRVRPDLLPRAELELPRADLVARPDARIDLRGKASDDWGLAKVSQWSRINDAPWTESVLVEKPGVETPLNVSWDLWEHGVQPGDLVATKFVAVDLKGNQSESRTLRVAVSDQGSGEGPLPGLDSQREFLRLLGEFREQTGAFQREAGALCEAVTRAGGFSPERLADQAQRARKTLEDLEANWEGLWEELARLRERAEEWIPGAVSAGPARLLARVGTHALAPAHDLFERILSPNLGDPAAAGSALRASAARAVQWTAGLSETLESLVGVGEMDRLGAALRMLSREQARLLASARKSRNDSIAGTPWMARQQVLLSEARRLAEGLTSVAALHEEDLSNVMNEAAKQIEDTRTVLEDLLQGEEPLPKATEELAWLVALFEGVSKKLPGWERATVALALDAARQSRRDARASGAIFSECAEALKQWNETRSGKNEPRAEFPQRRWSQGVALLKAHGDAEELRGQGDPVFVADLRAAASSLDALGQAESDGVEKIQELDFLARHFVFLEAAHHLFEARSELDALAADEHWQERVQDKPGARLLRWLWVRARLLDWPLEWAQLPKAGSESGSVAEALRIVRAIPRSEAFRAVSEASEWGDGAKPGGRGAELAVLSAEVGRALALLRKPLADSRRELAERTPALSEFLADLARKAEGLRNASEELHEAPASRALETLKTEAGLVLARQVRLGTPLDQVRALLRADANQQDLSAPEGRERARDADDALELLQEPPVRAAAALREASEAKDVNGLKRAGQVAALQQGELARRLEQLARHYALRAAEPGLRDAGAMARSRESLRETEKNAGTRDALNSRYAKAEQLAQLHGKTPEALLAHLEKALGANPAMRRELSRISEGLLNGATQNLADAGEREGALARSLEKSARTAPSSGDAPLPQTQAVPAPRPGIPGTPPNSGPRPESTESNPALASAMEEQAGVARAGRDAGAAVGRAGRHEERLENPLLGRQLRDLGGEIGAASEREVARVREALAAGRQGSEAAEAANAAMRAFSEALSKVGQLREGALPPNPASLPEPRAGVDALPKRALESALSPQEQVWMARALDSLDAATRGETPDAAKGAAPRQNARPAQNASDSEPTAQAMARAQAAVNAAVESAKAAQRTARARPGVAARATPNATGAVGSGIGSEGRAERNSAALPQSAGAPAGDWGKLPKQVAEGLAQGRNEKVSGDYRAQIETYYRVISEKSK